MSRGSLFLFLSLLSPLSPALAAPDEPARIVSMNICTDQLLLRVVEPGRIVSLSYLSADPAYSPLAQQAENFALNHGQAEEIIALAPDLVLTSQFSASFTAALLERRGYHVERFGFAATLDGAAEQISALGALTGRTAQAAALRDTLQSGVAASVARLRPLLDTERAVFLSNNGFVYGSGTLQDSFLQSLGLVNVASELGLSGPAPLSLEALLAAKPTLVFTPPVNSLDAQLAHPLLRHPLWRRLGGQVRRVALEERWFDCAGPEILRAYAALERELLP
ncbi:MAG: ABC transporter substrate-binding protein [Pseudomonadales bacterium]|jgi:iron complex transport system substrate-binding protein|nr:ABC transporter substrate-binding protein [Pseudomonadales bacterium]